MSAVPNVGAFLAALEQLPHYIGVVFRGCEARSHERWPGRALVTSGVLSTSRDPRVATENFMTDALYAIISRKGRAIEQFSAARHEREVVFIPGSVFTQVTRVRVDDLPITIVEEFDPRVGGAGAADLNEVKVDVGRAVNAALAAAEAPPSIPGKFAGDIT